MECDFFKDDQKIAGIEARLNMCKDASNWLCLQPNPLRYAEREEYHTDFGEINEDNKLEGRGIKIWNDGFIGIGYYEDGWPSTGNFIIIYRDGNFQVGEVYMREGSRCSRGTWYLTDGTEEQFD